MTGLSPEIPQPEQPVEGSALGATLAEVSRSLVAIQKRNYGKGPTRARSHLVKDVLTVILEGGYTTIERTLEEHGHSNEVIATRLAMQKAVETEMRTAVEMILGRSVRSFMSGNDPSSDLQAEVFVLEPAQEPGQDGELFALGSD
jgi:uncharacterized protein YbcI